MMYGPIRLLPAIVWTAWTDTASSFNRLEHVCSVTKVVLVFDVLVGFIEEIFDNRGCMTGGPRLPAGELVFVTSPRTKRRSVRLGRFDHP